MAPGYHQHYHAHCAGMSGPALRTAIGVVAGLCFLGFGYGQSDIGGFMVEPTFLKYFSQLDVARNPNTAVSTIAARDGGTVAAWNLGCVFGAAICIFIGDMMGRKGSIMLGLALEIIGKIIQGSSFSLAQYIVGRVIAGIGNGFITSTIPAWQAECLKTHQRGTLLLVSFGTCITFGVAVSYWIVYALSFTQPSSASWRVPILMALVFVVPCLALISFLPESPRWLILQGKEQAAIRALSALNEIPENSEDVRREIVQIKNAVKYMSSAPVSRVFTLGEYRYLHRTLLAILLQIMQQFTGINLFIQYLGLMFWQELHFKWELSLVLAGAASSVFFLASFIAVVGIDRFWGRRTLTMFGAAGMCLCMIILSIMDYVADVHGVTSGYYAMAAFLFVFNIFFSFGWQGMSWLWAVELVPLSVRGPANSMASAANWLANFIIVLVTPTLFVNTVWRTYIIFAVTNAAIIPTIYYLFPETGGRSLEEVDALFRAASERPRPWLAIVAVARSEPCWFDKNGEPTDSYASTDSGTVTSEAAFEKRLVAIAGRLESPSDSPASDGRNVSVSPDDSQAAAIQSDSDVSAVAPAPDVGRVRSSSSPRRTFRRSFVAGRGC